MDEEVDPPKSKSKSDTTQMRGTRRDILAAQPFNNNQVFEGDNIGGSGVIKNCETRLFRGRKLINVTQSILTQSYLKYTNVNLYLNHDNI